MAVNARSAVVIGAGIVGATTALALRQARWTVLLLDRGEPGAACSSGNAGLVTPSLLPLASPATLKMLPRLLTSTKSPLRVDWRSLPSLSGWGVQFLRYSNSRAFEEGAVSLHNLAAGAYQTYRTLLADRTGAYFRETGYLIAYTTDAAFRAAAATARLRQRCGAEAHVLTGAEARALEPALGPRVVGAIHIAGAKYVVDPQGLVTAIVDEFIRAGGAFRKVEVRGVASGRGNAPPRVVLPDGEARADLIVIAAGSETPFLAKPLGLRLSITCERGYHAMLPAPLTPLTYPVMSGEGAFVLTPMRAGLRIAGLSDFARPHAAPRWDLLNRAIAQIGTLCPSIRAEITSRWVGVRPATPDSLPLVGRLPGHSRIIVNAGHGHAGLTLAAVTA